MFPLTSPVRVSTLFKSGTPLARKSREKGQTHLSTEWIKGTDF